MNCKIIFLFSFLTLSLLNVDAIESILNINGRMYLKPVNFKEPQFSYGIGFGIQYHKFIPSISLSMFSERNHIEGLGKDTGTPDTNTYQLVHDDHYVFLIANLSVGYTIYKNKFWNISGGIGNEIIYQCYYSVKEMKNNNITRESTDDQFYYQEHNLRFYLSAGYALFRNMRIDIKPFYVFSEFNNYGFELAINYVFI
jgi:hypothetical protein